MEFEKRIFKNRRFDPLKGKQYGFSEEEKGYVYRAPFHHGEFIVSVHVRNLSDVYSQLIDSYSEEEYLNIRIDSFQGEYVNTLREEYEALLQDISDRCFTETIFFNTQADALSELIRAKYAISAAIAEESAQFSFENGRIFAQIDSRSFLHVRMKNRTTDQMLKKSGLMKSDRIKENNWIMIPLDHSFSDEELMDFIVSSYDATDISSAWIIPANLKYYDVITPFRTMGYEYWPRIQGIDLNENVYIYITKPVGALLFKTVVEDISLHVLPDGSTYDSMKLRLVHEFSKEEYSMEILEAYGVRSIRSARHIPAALEKELRKY